MPPSTYGDLILGYLRYSGGNSTGSGSFFLYNGSTFVETGTASLGSSTTAGDDSGGNMNVGNQEGPAR